MSYRQQAEEITQRLDQMGRPAPQEQVGASPKYNESNLRAMIKGVNITYTNAYIKNLTATKQAGDLFNLEIPSQDNVVNIPDCKFGFRLRLYDTAAEEQVNPSMYNLPDCRSLFGTSSVTLNGKELQLSGLQIDKNRPFLTALLDRVKHRAVAKNNLLNNKYEDAQGFATISQQAKPGAVANDSGQLVEQDDGCLTGLQRMAIADNTIGNINATIKSFNRGKVSSLVEHFGESQNHSADLVANKSVQTIMKDSKRRLLQSQKHYICKQTQAAETTGNVALPVIFKNISGTDATETRRAGEYQNYYEVRLGDIIPELEAFKNFYMGGNKFNINLKLLPVEQCMSKIMKPYTAEGFNQETLAEPAANRLYDNAFDPDNNKALIADYAKVKYQLADTYLQVPHLLVSDSDKLAFKDIQQMIGVPLKRYQLVQQAITSSGQFTIHETLRTRNLTGIIVFFSSVQGQRAGNFLTTADAAGKGTCIKHTDYTYNNMVDPAVDGGKRGLQQNHDHFALPVQELRVVIGNNVYKNNLPPIADHSVAQYLTAMDSSSMVLGDDRVYDVSLNDWMTNKCAFFVPIGKGYSGLDVSDGRVIQVQCMFKKDTSAGDASGATSGAINVYNRTIVAGGGGLFEMNVVYCCADQVRFDKGYTNVE